jgi:hypothetical protein
MGKPGIKSGEDFKIFGTAIVDRNGSTLTGGATTPDIGWDTTTLKSTSGNYAIVAGDDGAIIVGTGGGTQNMTLPASAAVSEGWRVTVLKSHDSGGDVLVHPANATTELLNGTTATAITLPSISSWCTVVHQTTNSWFFIGNF